MNITIHTLTPSPSSYYREGRKEYEKRLSRYCKIKYLSYKNEKQRQKAFDKLSQIAWDGGKDHVIYVTSGTEVSSMDSTTLAGFIEEQGIYGVSALHFLVGFPEDVNFCPEEYKSTLSISNMTIPADLLSFILEEQIYRAYRIINKEPYHK